MRSRIHWRSLFRPDLGHAATLLVLALLTPACAFNPSGYANPDSLLPFRDDTVVVQPTSSDQRLVYEAPGQIAVVHGESCAGSNQDGQEIRVRLEEQLGLPREYDRGTVIANGYHLRYLDSDHHVKGLGTAIGQIQMAPGLLKWEAAGILSDDDFNDGYEWCYTYTAVAWNSQQIAAVVDDTDMGHAFRDKAWTHGTALLPMPGFLFNKAFAGLEEVAVLPRGYAAIWAGSDDHHILQYGYHLGDGEVSVEGGKKYGNDTVASPTSEVAQGFVTWESTSFLKDNDLEREQMVVELVSALGGRDVGVVNLPFTLAPREDSSWTEGCASTGTTGPETEDRVVENVPFQFAIPVLSSWDLAYVCGDEHVTEIGAWIPEWDWQPGTTPTGGTLHYKMSALLRDKDGFPTFHRRTQIKILGFRPIPPPAKR